jgi:hypothetical protein
LKGSTTEVKRLTDWKLLPSDVRSVPSPTRSFRSQCSPRSQRQHKQEQQKVSADFQRALETFQTVVRRSAERQRLFVERAKASVDVDSGPVTYVCSISTSFRVPFAHYTLCRTNDEPAGQLLELFVRISLTFPLRASYHSFLSCSQQTQPQLHDNDIEFQEQLIQEREGEITQIEQGITELNQIFKDLGQIVGEQQSMVGAFAFPFSPTRKVGY